MALSEAKRQGNARYLATQDTIILRVAKATYIKGAITTAAANAGQSVQAYILQAVDARMHPEAQQASECAAETDAGILSAAAAQIASEAAASAGKPVREWLTEAVQQQRQQEASARQLRQQLADYKK